MQSNGVCGKQSEAILQIPKDLRHLQKRTGIHALAAKSNHTTKSQVLFGTFDVDSMNISVIKYDMGAKTIYF